MLHILLLILKIVGILLLAVLCLLILAAAVLILNPVRYRLEGDSEEWADTIRGRFRFHWLFHLIRGEALFEEGELKWQIRIAWKKFGSPSYPGEKSPDPEKNRSGFQKGQDKSREEKPGDPREEKRTRSEENLKTEHCRADASSEEVKELPPASDQTESAEEKESEKTETEKTHRAAGGSRKNGSPEKKEETLYQKFLKRAERLQKLFRKTGRKIKALLKRKDRLHAFLSDETHKKAFAEVLRESRRFLGYLHPYVLKAEVEFGFEDPALTGYTLAWISLIYPAVGEFAEIRPDFHHRVLRGNLLAEGKIRILYVLIPAWNLVRNKNVRTTFRHIRRWKL